MVTTKELEDILYKEKIKEIKARVNDPNGNVRQEEDRVQYYVDNMTLDSRSASIVGKEQGEHWWAFAPQAQKYRADLAKLENIFLFIIGGYMAFWIGIAFWFLLQF